jgi:hypothetical protein
MSERQDATPLCPRQEKSSEEPTQHKEPPDLDTLRWALAYDGLQPHMKLWYNIVQRAPVLMWDRGNRRWRICRDAEHNGAERPAP